MKINIKEFGEFNIHRNSATMMADSVKGLVRARGYSCEIWIGDSTRRFICHLKVSSIRQDGKTMKRAEQWTAFHELIEDHLEAHKVAFELDKRC